MHVHRGTVNLAPPAIKLCKGVIVKCLNKIYRVGFLNSFLII